MASPLVARESVGFFPQPAHLHMCRSRVAAAPRAGDRRLAPLRPATNAFSCLPLPRAPPRTSRSLQRACSLQRGCSEQESAGPSVSGHSGDIFNTEYITPNSHARVRIRRCANTSNTNRKNEYAFAITHSVSRRRIANSEYAFDVSCSKRSDRILSTEFVFAIRYSLFTA